MKISRKLRRIAAAALAVILVWGSVNLSDMGIYTVNAAEDSSGIKTPYYNDGQHKYIYDSGDILGAATHVHLFGRTVISSVHTHGNIFCQIGDLGETGTRDENNTIGGVTGKFNPLDWYHEVNYIQNELRTINASSALDILVVGNGINYREPQGGDKRWPIMTNNGEIYLDKTNHIYQDGNGTLIDFDREFQILKDRSKEWAAKDTTDGIECSIENKDDGSRWIDVDNLNTGDTNVFLNLTYEEWIACGSDEITIRNLNGNTKNTGILIINIDMKDCENYLQTEWQTEPTLTLNGSGIKVTTVNSNIKGGEEFGNREYNTTEYGAYRIIYNIYDSGSNDQLYHGKVTFGGTVCGTILAPCAEITVGAVNGTVAADTIIHNGNESHRMDVCALDATRDPEETKPEDPKEEEPEDPKEEEPTKPENPGSPEDPDKPNTPDEPTTPDKPNTPPSTPNTPPSLRAQAPGTKLKGPSRRYTTQR
ncbi:MAG: choice-of-anchor A family protein, partial [Lachnospiraceae bacterium]|nr:choice-of-anchor A family protein [Lachnospiraceae bacterium]